MSVGATAALRQASYDRMTAIRVTRASELERYFENIRNQVGALATDTSTLSAIEELQAAWQSIPFANSTQTSELRDYYKNQNVPDAWFPSQFQTVALQRAYLSGNPHPPGAKDLLLEASLPGSYDEVHARFHPTFHRYKTAFGYYDVFLIEPTEGRILYTVMKEVDLGVPLAREPYNASPLAAVFRKALDSNGDTVMVDYQPYVPSGLSPAAFVAAPLRRAGTVIGILAIQVAIDEVNAVMSGGGQWHEQGFGDTGNVYTIGPDNTLRSDLRAAIENPEEYLRELRAAGIGEAAIERIRRNRTAVLAYPVNLDIVERIRGGESGTEIGRDAMGTEVLRSHGPLHVGDFQWAIIAEMGSSEALAPVAAMQRRIFLIGGTVALVLFLAASWLGASIADPILMVASMARRVGQGERGFKINLPGNDEISQLASDFNRMNEDLERTMVSKRELEVLAGRLITAQEDERRRVGRELHDDFTQRVAAAAIETGRLVNVPSANADELRAGLKRLKEQLAAISEEVHGLSRRLHPAMLDDLGLIGAIEIECRAVFERGLFVDFQADGDTDDLSHDLRLALYRIVQEGLRNIHKHSGATEAHVTISRDADSVSVEIRDEGNGFDRSQPGWRPGLGLASMEERARLLGGEFQVESRIGKGTTIRVKFPIAHE